MSAVRIRPRSGMLATRFSVSVRLPGEVVRPGGSQVGSQWPRRG